MFESQGNQLKSALDLGLNEKDLVEIILSIPRLRTWHPHNREAIWEQVDEVLKEKIKRLRDALCYKREFRNLYEQIGIDYCNIQKEDSGLIRFAITNYLLTKKQEADDGNAPVCIIPSIEETSSTIESKVEVRGCAFYDMMRTNNEE